MVCGQFLWDIRALKDVALPEGIKKIGMYWFAHADIESVEIPREVKIIEEGAFYRCKKLREVKF